MFNICYRYEIDQFVTLFVDAENSTIEPGLILETVEAEFGKPRVRQAYSKWSGNPKLKTNPIHKYRNAGFQTITCDTGSNNADIKLSVEALAEGTEVSSLDVVNELIDYGLVGTSREIEPAA